MHVIILIIRSNQVHILICLLVIWISIYMGIYWNISVGKDFCIFCFIAFISRCDSWEQEAVRKPRWLGAETNLLFLSQGSIASYTVSIFPEARHTHIHVCAPNTKHSLMHTPNHTTFLGLLRQSSSEKTWWQKDVCDCASFSDVL